MQLSKPSSKLEKLITILKKGLNYKCYNEWMLRKIAYSFLMTSNPWTDLNIAAERIYSDFANPHGL